MRMTISMPPIKSIQGYSQRLGLKQMACIWQCMHYCYASGDEHAHSMTGVGLGHLILSPEMFKGISP
jgi:hypothetical protein